MELEHQMLVSEYAQNVINNRPLKYGTRQSYIKIIKSLGIWETETDIDWGDPEEAA